MSYTPEALRLADRLTLDDYYEFDASLHCPRAAAELRRLHAVNADLLEALKAMLDLELRMRPPGYRPSDTVKAASAVRMRAEGASHE